MNCSGATLAALKYREVPRTPNIGGVVQDLHAQGKCPSIKVFAAMQGVDLGLVSLLNLFLGLEGGHVVCMFGSNWCRLLLELGSRIGIERLDAG